MSLLLTAQNAREPDRTGLPPCLPYTVAVLSVYEYEPAGRMLPHPAHGRKALRLYSSTAPQRRVYSLPWAVACGCPRPTFMVKSQHLC